MELNHLRYFYEVARAGSFSAAANALRVSQPSLSKTVALLEARAEVKLLERSKKGVSLTPIGMQIYQKCEEIFNTLIELENTCQQSKEVCEGHLRFGASDHIGNYLLVPKITQMSKLHPKVIPSIFIGAPAETVKLVLKKELEFALFFTKIDDDELEYEKFMTVPLAAVYSKKYNLTQTKKFPGGQIGSIQQQYKSNPSKIIFEALNQNPPLTFESNSQELQKRLCLEGAGIAVLARFMVEEELKKNILLEIPIPKNKEATIFIAKRKKQVLSLAAKKFLELLLS